MIGTRYWSTGITVLFRGDGAVAADLNFYDDGFCHDHSTQGTLKTRYYVGENTPAGAGDDALTTAIDLLRGDAERLGIRFGVADPVQPTLYVLQPTLYVCETAGTYLPDGWREAITAQAERLGWVPGVGSTPEPATGVGTRYWPTLCPEQLDLLEAVKRGQVEQTHDPDEGWRAVRQSPGARPHIVTAAVWQLERAGVVSLPRIRRSPSDLTPYPWAITMAGRAALAEEER